MNIRQRLNIGFLVVALLAGIAGYAAINVLININRDFAILLGMGLVMLIIIGSGLIMAKSVLAPIIKLKDEATVADKVKIDKMEEEIKILKEKNVELEAVERNRTKELEEAHKDLEYTKEKLARTEKLAALGQLSTAIAHEMRNPLSVIRTSVYNLKSNLSKDSPVIYENLKILDKELARAGKIIIDILEYSRPIGLMFKPTNINMQIEEALNSLKQQARYPENVELNLELKEDLPHIPADPESLRRAFMNIIINAIDAMPEGGQLKISTDLAPENKTVKIRFSDTGGGIPEGNLSKLKEPFFSTRRKGIGLGLPITYEIVERHKGNIDVRSELNRGTTFTINLPKE